MPRLPVNKIEENHKHLSRRMLLYKERGLDFVKSREFILKKAQLLQGGILEIGTGNGYTTLALAKRGHTFISIDKDKEPLKTTALNLAYENVLTNVKFYVMDGRTLDFASGSFKNVVVVNLFHHVDDINKILSEIDRVLCANGKAVLADFNKDGMAIVEAVHKQEGRMHENSNVTRDYIYSYLYGLGYKIESYEEKCHWVLIAIKELRK